MASFAEIHKNTAYDSIDSTFKEESLQSRLVNVLKNEYRKYLRNKTIYDCLVDCVGDEELDTDLQYKLDDIIHKIKLKQSLQFDKKHVLGIALLRIELTYQEAEKLKSVFQKKLLEKKTKVYSDFKKITSKDLDQVTKDSQYSTSLCDSSLTQRDQTVIDYKEKLVKEQQRFAESVTNRDNLIEEMLDLRLNKVPKLCNQATRDFKAKIESNYLKAKIAESKMKLDIFMEVPKAIEAYQDLIKDINQQQEECELVIEQMKEMKMKYEDVSGREYDEILKTYLMYQSSIDELNKMYTLLN